MPEACRGKLRHAGIRIRAGPLRVKDTLNKGAGGAGRLHGFNQQQNDQKSTFWSFAIHTNRQIDKVSQVFFFTFFQIFLCVFHL